MHAFMPLRHAIYILSYGLPIKPRMWLIAMSTRSLMWCGALKVLLLIGAMLMLLWKVGPKMAIIS